MENHGFLQQALVYLSAGVIAVPIFSRLGLGSVLGYLDRRHGDRPVGLAPDHRIRETVLHFAELGVVLLLFLIGLELEPQRLWALRRSIFGMGAAQVIATALAVAAIAVALGLPIAVGLVAAWRSRCPPPPSGSPRCGEKPAADGGRARQLRGAAVPGPGGDPALLAIGLLGGENARFDWLDAAERRSA